MLTSCRSARSGLLLAALALAAATVEAQSPVAAAPRATVREFRKTFRTYPYSDPNPIPVVGRVYPYFRFDGYTDTPIDREWTVVELENAYLRVWVLPEIGGKIWAAFEKSTGRSFLYNNQVVKFRDIAMRGPWTSGGIEANYGIIGHTPNCATPVDYLVKPGADGSASVVVGTLDLLTRTTWRLEVTLPADRAYFTTRSYWYNATPLEQPYYTWMNAAIKAAGNLELIYPGTHHIGHSGEVSPWPIDPATGRNLAFYEQNDFGPAKSYHVVGRRAEFYGAYWHDEDFGMARYAARDDKLGKKAWIWGLSRQGMIWEDLLTDEDGQYVEVQSGRLFNQAAEDSTRTPFKHTGFAPHAADTWTEYWFPVNGTGGFVKADQHGALNVTGGNGRLRIAFSPVAPVEGPIEVRDGTRVLFAGRVALKPMEAWVQHIETTVGPERISVRIGDAFEYDAAAEDALSRPVAAPRDFDWNSAFGLWTAGKEWIRQREYGQARTSLEASLGKDPHFVSALGELATLDLRERRDQSAWDRARLALSVDTYDPLANYVYGLASRRLGKAADAKDGFEVAALSPAMRPAALIELSKVHLAEGRWRHADDYAAKAAEAQPLALDPWQVRALVARLRNDTTAAGEYLDRLLRIDALNAFARFERHLAAPADGSLKDAFVGSVRNEMPHETFLELAAWYLSVGRPGDARRVLALSPASTEVLYWRAYLAGLEKDPAAATLLTEAEAASPELVFPFRAESLDVFEWAARTASGWKPRYYLALVRWGLNDPAAARELLAGIGDVPDFPPFYAARALAHQQASRERALADLERAAAMAPRAWRYGKLLAEHLLHNGDAARAREVVARYAAADPRNHVLGLLLARTLLATGRYAEADASLARLKVLPFEGATAGRALYREAKLLLAAEALRASNAEASLQLVAAAREWPEHLGAGKPYPENVDERLEDWLQMVGLERMRRDGEARAILTRLAEDRRPGFGLLVAALAETRLGRSAQAERTLEAWAGATTDVELVKWGRTLLAGSPSPPPATAPVEARVLSLIPPR
jgi:Tfp pilus assembly protein PilF